MTTLEAMLFFQKLSYIVVIVTAFCTKAYSQAIIQNERFSYYADNYAVLNPGHLGMSYDRQLTIQYLSFTGPRRVVNTYFASAYYRSEESKLTLGINVYSENQGRFLQNNTVAAMFSFKLFEDEHQVFQAGGSIGTANYLVKDNDFGAGGTAWGLDGAAGLWYKRDQLSIGMAFTHLFNTELVPVNEQFVLARSLNGFIGYEFDFGDWDFTPLFVYQFESQLGGRLQLINKVVYRDVFLGTLAYHTEQMFSLGIGTPGLQIKEVGHLGFNLNFNFHLVNRNEINSNQYEIGVSYH